MKLITTFKIIASAAGVVLATFSAGCGGGGGNGDGGEACFVATQGDFTDYQKWDAFDGGTVANDGLGLDGAQRTIYINKVPSHGSKTFPVGTMIVKTTAGGVTFAMAMRGCDFNPPVGDWEWFELTPGTGDTPLISWRGTAPPAGNVYGGALFTCNGCHSGFTANDYVGGSAAQLSQF